MMANDIIVKGEIEVEIEPEPEPEPVHVYHLEVEKTCRLCNKSVLVNGVITNTRVLYNTFNREKSLCERFRDIGVLLPRRPGACSGRICKSCSNVLVKVEAALATLDKWKREHNGVAAEAEATSDGAGAEKNGHGDKTKKAENEPPVKLRLSKIKTETRVSTTEVYINYPSKTHPEKYMCDPDFSGVVNNLAKRNFPTAARLMVQHTGLMDALKPVMCEVIANECKHLCRRREGFMLWKNSPEELRKFCLLNLRKDLEKMAPFMFSVIFTISGMQTNHACAAAAIALRGRENNLSAFAYHINSLLRSGGAKKYVFERLSRMGITTTHNNMITKHRAMSALCGEVLQRLKAKRETPATAQESVEEPKPKVKRKKPATGQESTGEPRPKAKRKTPATAQESTEEPTTKSIPCPSGLMNTQTPATAQDSIEEPTTKSIPCPSGLMNTQTPATAQESIEEPITKTRPLPSGLMTTQSVCSSLGYELCTQYIRDGK